ncbi:SCO2400 family protein [Streptomyces sp. NPDC002817]|uniref:SCO2400 family protein n=1 Tax=Streptomyces sp. NPDC088357 TaxID=3154655 RepID=UPI0034219E0C
MNTGRPQMDYCSTCRRHLNGALVCPGCGAYAPDIAPLAVGTTAPAPDPVAATWQSPSHLWHEQGSVAEEGGEAPREQPYDSPDAPSPAPTGRAARRRQRERWKKTQRRALVATAVALVGGGLTITSMNRQSTDRTQAASAPDREAMGIAEEQAAVPVPAAATPADPNRSKGATSTNRSSTANAPHEQTATTPQATPTTEAVQRDSVTDSLNTAVSAAGSQAASTVSDTTDSAAQTSASPTPSATDNTDTSSTDTTAATPAPSESSSSSSPSGLCLLGLVCIS